MSQKIEIQTKKFKFITPFSNSETRTSQDLSNQYEQTYIELEPYARNDKGEFLNDSPFPKLVEGEKVNVQEQIDSYFEDVDIYSILKKVAATGDFSYLNRKAGFYADISNLPNNYNDLNNYYKSVASSFKTLPKEIQDLIKAGASDAEVAKALDALDPANKNIKNNNDGSQPKEPASEGGAAPLNQSKGDSTNENK